MKSIPKIWQRTPISYYRGKQTMLPYILPLIPEHRVYIEPFFGGGAVFWAKQPAKVEIINDFNTNVWNFYHVLKNDYLKLKELIDKTLVCRDVYKSALVIYHSPMLFSQVQRAWAFWFTTNAGFSNQIGNCRFSNTGKVSKTLQNRKIEFSEVYAERLQLVQIENNDACAVINSHDCSDAFIYCDPPYVGANQGHYGGYTQEHFNELLQTLSQVKGKFLLSSYDNLQLERFAKDYNWYQKTINLNLGSSHIKGKRRNEVLTSNYPLE